MTETQTPARVVVDEAMTRVSESTLAYLANPSRKSAQDYDRAFSQLRIALDVLAAQPREEVHAAAVIVAAN